MRPGLDLQAACASFVFALITGMQYVATGCSRLALVIGADCNSRIVNPADQHTYPLVRRRGRRGAAGPRRPRTRACWPMRWDPTVRVPTCSAGRWAARASRSATAAEFNGRHFLHMYGRPVFKWAIRMLRETVFDVLRRPT